MVTRAKRPERREEALNRQAIVDAAVELLDSEGEDGLTFRALAAKLSTGAGAIYWHVANKDELLVAATDTIVSAAIAASARASTPRQTIRTIAIGVFDAIDAHPWVGTQLARAPSQSQLAREPSQSALLDIFERIGRALQALRVPRKKQFTAACTLLSYILGVGSQNAADARMAEPAVDRDAYLDAAASSWEALDADKYAFTRAMGAALRTHDDRAEFLAGIDLILTGITGG